MTAETTGEAAGRTRRRGAGRTRAPINQLPWRQFSNPHPKLRLISDDEVERLHQGSVRILEEVGVRFFLPEALDLLETAGAIVDRADSRARIGRDIVEEAIRLAPARVTLSSRNPRHTVSLGGDEFVCTNVLGPPFSTNLDRGRRSGTLADYAELMKLAQFFNVVHMIGGSPVEPMDVEVPVRHLEAALVMLEVSDKVPYTFCHSVQRIHDTLDMIAMARGLTREQLRDTPSTYAIINTNSPLQYDTSMAAGVIEMARHGQPILITPFSLAGASMPVTLAGAIALSNAEFLAGLVLAELARPGAPVLTGAKTTNVDMRTGSPAFGGPEFQKSTIIGGQLARRYGVPYRCSNFCTSNAADAEAVYQAEGAIWSAVMSGCNLLMHAVGWIEGGLCASYEKFVLDVEMVQMMAVMLEPVEVSEATLAFEEVAMVGPGGHYFSTPLTLDTYKTAFYQPLISSTRNYGAWVEDGARDATHRANAIWKQALEDYETPPMPAERLEAASSWRNGRQKAARRSISGWAGRARWASHNGWRLTWRSHRGGRAP
ncbi:MAG: trimethylamine methyltransferase family protein [Hyphomicrobiaceae bacterium]